VDEEMAFMGQRASSGPAREKRFLAAVIAAASAIFSFGLGISTEVELNNLRDTTNGSLKINVSSWLSSWSWPERRTRN
jgi:hypothetical protein